jgi:hypothetical protein
VRRICIRRQDDRPAILDPERRRWWISGHAREPLITTSEELDDELLGQGSVVL